MVQEGGQEAQDSLVTMFEGITWPPDRSMHLRGGTTVSEGTS